MPRRQTREYRRLLEDFEDDGTFGVPSSVVRPEPGSRENGSLELSGVMDSVDGAIQVLEVYKDANSVIDRDAECVDDVAAKLQHDIDELEEIKRTRRSAVEMQLEAAGIVGKIKIYKQCLDRKVDTVYRDMVGRVGQASPLAASAIHGYQYFQMEHQTAFDILKKIETGLAKVKYAFPPAAIVAEPLSYVVKAGRYTALMVGTATIVRSGEADGLLAKEDVGDDLDAWDLLDP